MSDRCASQAALAALILGLIGCKVEVTDPRQASSDATLAEPATLDLLERAYRGETAPEGARMLLAIDRGADLQAGVGWFGPGQSRYSWEWLAARHAMPDADSIAQEQFAGRPEWFASLDRNGDGRIESRDVTIEAVEPPAPMDERMELFTTGGPLGGPKPSKERRLRSLFDGEMGSFNEGPAVGELAPEFHLRTHDGSRTVRLSEVLGEKPVVLVFGTLTCDEFPPLYARVEEIAKRFAGEATFLFIYVRETHPVDRLPRPEPGGIRQAKTYAERAETAAQCPVRLGTTMPILVDPISDPVGHAYSGMPARLYVIAPEGTVTYKSGRGPFGFSPDEMERALVMTLLESSADAVVVE